MHRHLDNPKTPEDKTYQKVMRELNRFLERLSSDEDRQLLSKMVSDSCHKHHQSILAMERDDPSLLMPLIMALLVDQQSVIDRLKDKKLKMDNA
jgi:hypothetical protein